MLEQYAALFIVVVIVALGSIVIRRSLSETGHGGGRARRVLVVVFGVSASTVLLIVQFVPSNQRWLWALAILHASFVLVHAIHLAVFKNRRFFEASQEPDYSGIDPSLIPIVKAAQNQERQYYSTASLALRFALPAVLLILASLTVGYSLADPPSWGAYQIDENFLAGARIGVVGAYIYILLFLGRRAMRYDITPGAVVWSSVTITSGPLLAGSLQVLFIGQASESWTNMLLPFAAGFSLHFISEFVEATIRRVFATPGDGVRRIPLSRLRGVTRDIEERLLEEGIADVSMLAMANPHRLRRNTRFDKRQITAWIDEAILMTYLPHAWQSLETDGITGAIDLVWYSTYECSERDRGQSDPSNDQMREAIKRLAERNKLEVNALEEVIWRMAQDAQVLLIRALYQLDDTESSDDNSLFRGFQAENMERPRSERTEKSQPQSTRSPTGLEPDMAGITTDREAQRQKRYEQTRGLFVVHTWRRSSRRGQLADIIIRLAQHRDGPLTRGTVQCVEYYLGPKFSTYPLVKTNAADLFTLSIAAWGPMLCLARVTFTDNTPPVDLERYIDFDIQDSPSGG